MLKSRCEREKHKHRKDVKRVGRKSEEKITERIFVSLCASVYCVAVCYTASATTDIVRVKEPEK